MVVMNRKREGDRAYITGLHNQQLGFYAQSLNDAKQKAVEHFKPSKKDRNLVWVELAEEE